MPQGEHHVACDIDQTPMSNAKWSERPGVNGMEQVKELLTLLDRRRVDGVIVATNFTFCRCQPGKERAHPANEFLRDIDGTREVPEPIDRDEVMRWVEVLFNLTGCCKIGDLQRAFSVVNLPPWVKVLFLVSFDSFFVVA